MSIVHNSRYGVMLMGSADKDLSERQYWETRWARSKGAAIVVVSLFTDNIITQEEREKLMIMIYSPDEENLGVAEALIHELIKKKLSND